ncbi:MAG: hypothetical protein WCS12_02725 [Acholeplasmataceae bacterium]|jgi:hypothetical protein|nr:hypothetical protein [Acholeplasmataceae bacterium]MCK9234041.1 hypothetical protein [Acholeplasmataceae bacterium]
MLKRLRILTLLQLKNKSKRFDKMSKRLYTSIAVQVVIVAIISLVMGLIVYAIKKIFYIPVNEYFTIFVLFITQTISIITALIGLSSDLYQSKDNQIIFPLPVKNDEIFLSKMIVYYIYELFLNLFILIPLLIAIGYHQNANVLYYLNIIPITFILPLISVSIATLLTVPFVIIKSFLKNHSKISALTILVFFSLIFYLVYFLVTKIPTPIRIVQLYNRFIVAITLLMQKVASIATIYTWIGFVLYRVNFFLHYSLVILTSVALITLNYLIAKPLYFKLTSLSLENTVKVTKHKRLKESKSLFWTFFKKELIIAKRSPNELINNYSLLLTLPIIMYLLNYIFMNMNRRTLGNDLVLVINVLIVALIVTGSNTASASAITTEGYEFILLKSAPYDTSKMAWAKILFNFLFTTFVIIISFILFAVVLPVYPKKDIIFLFVFILLLNFGHIIWSLQLDVLSPKLSDYATSGSLSNNHNIKKSLSIGLVLSLFSALLAAFAFIVIKEIGWILLIGAALLFALIRFSYFRLNLKAYFMDIEY